MKGVLTQDLDVQPQRPLVDVVEVLGDAQLHFFHRLGFTPMPGDLGQPGDARLEAMTSHVGAHLAGVINVVGDGMRARADQGHLAEQHVEQLRQFVDGTAAQKASERGDAVIVAGGLAHLADRRARASSETSRP